MSVNDVEIAGDLYFNINTLQGFFAVSVAYGEMWKISYIYVNEQAGGLQSFSRRANFLRLRHENDIYQNLSRIGINFICLVIMKYWSQISLGERFHEHFNFIHPDNDILR